MKYLMRLLYTFVLGKLITYLEDRVERVVNGEDKPPRK